MLSGLPRTTSCQSVGSSLVLRWSSILSGTVAPFCGLSPLTVSAGRLSPRLFSVPSGASAAPLPAPKESVGHSVSLSIGQRVYVPSWVPPV